MKEMKFEIEYYVCQICELKIYPTELIENKENFTSNIKCCPNCKRNIFTTIYIEHESH